MTPHTHRRRRHGCHQCRPDTGRRFGDTIACTSSTDRALTRRPPNQAELLLKQGLIAYEPNDTNRALDLLSRAATFARRAGGDRILAEIALDLARF